MFEYINQDYPNKHGEVDPSVTPEQQRTGFWERWAAKRVGAPSPEQVRASQDKHQARQRVQGLLGQRPGFFEGQQQGASMPGQPAPQFARQPVMEDGEGTGLLGGKTTPAEFYGGLLSTSGYENVGAQGLNGILGARTQKPTSLMQNAAEIYGKGSPKYIDLIRQSLLKPQNQITIGAGKPLGAGAANWVNPQGQNPNPTMDVYEASQQGFRPQSTEQRKSTQSAGATAPVYGQMIELGFGKEGKDSLFPESNKNVGSRLIGGAQTWLSGVTDSDARVSLYQQQQKSMVTGLARLVGQVGVLTETDVKTVASMFPTAGLTPKPQAMQQFKAISTLLKGKGVPDEKLSALGFPEWALKDTWSDDKYNYRFYNGKIQRKAK